MRYNLVVSGAGDSCGRVETINVYFMLGEEKWDELILYCNWCDNNVFSDL